MNHVAVRRFALTAASVSFSALTALVLLVSVIFGDDLLIPEQTIVQASLLDEQALEFPASISCTNIVVESVASYDGLFYEDGTGREVLNVAAVLVRNTGAEMIPYVHVVLRTESTSYIFDGFWIPAGGAALIPEKNALQFPQECIVNCFGWATVPQQVNTYDISAQDVSMGEIAVKNLSGTEIRNLTLYHKTYLQESDIYIGGRAFESRISCIGAGETVILSPQNYAAGYSKLVYYE